MAETFARNSAALGTSDVLVYGAPNNAATDTAIVLSVMIANVDGAASADVNVRIQDSAGVDIAGAKLAHAMTVPAGTSLELIANKLVLNNGERLVASASAAGDLQMTVSSLEMT